MCVCVDNSAMKFWLVPSVLAALSGFAASSPVESRDLHAAEEPTLYVYILDTHKHHFSILAFPLKLLTTTSLSSPRMKRASGSLSAWTGSGNGCAGTPGFTWQNPGQNQCIQFVSGNGQSKIVQRLSWSGQACQVYGYGATGCNTNEQATAFGSDLCFNNVLFLSFKVVC